MSSGDSNSRELSERAKKVIPGGVNSPVRFYEPYPFFAARARDSRIWDVEGNERVDFCMAYGPLLLGHARREVIEAVAEQMERGWLYGAPAEAELKLVERICKDYRGLEMARLVNSGTEAVMSALRLARAFTKKEKIVFFEGCFHGAHDSSIVRERKAGVPRALAPLALEAEFNNLSSLEKVLKENKGDVAAVILEPVMGNCGVVPPEQGFLRGVREACDRHNSLLIFDEVITGYRLSFGGAQKKFKVHADLVALGKIIGGGFPIGAYGGRADVMKKVAPAGECYQAGTFCGHPASAVAGLKTIELIEKESAIERADRIAAGAAKLLREKFPDSIVNQLSSMFQIFFGVKKASNKRDIEKLDRKRFSSLHAHLLRNRVFMSPSPLESWFSSSAHREEDLEVLGEALSSFER